MPPLGLMYLSSSLKSQGIGVKFYDEAGRQKQRRVPSAKYYGITATTPQFPAAVELLRHLKNRHPAAKVCLGGPHATLRPNDGMRAGFDCVVIGEGERAILNFMEGCSGISEFPVRDLNNLPFPDRSMAADYEYLIDGKLAATMMTSRGNCPFSCVFCTKSWKTPLRFRSEQSVKSELKHLRNLGYEAVMLYDDEFFLNISRDYKIMQALHRHGFVWRCFTRSTLVTPRLATDAYNYGCREILLGVESGSNQILTTVNKQVTYEDNIREIKSLHHAGIRVKASLIIGLPGESLITLSDTWHFCEIVELYVSDWDFDLLVPYPGSPIYEDPDGYEIKFNKADVYAPYKGGEWKAIVSTPTLSKQQITKWRKKFHLRFKGKEYL